MRPMDTTKASWLPVRNPTTPSTSWSGRCLVSVVTFYSCMIAWFLRFVKGSRWGIRMIPISEVPHARFKLTSTERATLAASAEDLVEVFEEQVHPERP